ncbi:MAG: BrnT family toxin [Elusimicrobia bacterium]|jgi:uncharacterized DUF497 family protein|nr:BrnT family toxin [Elusimicrobiota bacterium]
MKSIRFVWDEKKNKINQKKHGVRFEEAQTVFYDPRAVQFFDPDHSSDEDRFILLGLSARLNVLVVCHCYRESDSLIRIISARKADSKERDNYRR